MIRPDMARTWRAQVFDSGGKSRMRLTRRLIGRRGAITVFWIVLATTAAMARQGVGTVTETVTTLRHLNGRHEVSERVVTHRARSGEEERVVIETYTPSIEAGRLALSQRIDRVTTVKADGTHTVEETAELSPVAPSEPLRVVQRIVTTVRRAGTGGGVIERQVFEPEASGRLVLVQKQTEHRSRH